MLNLLSSVGVNNDTANNTDKAQLSLGTVQVMVILFFISACGYTRLYVPV